MVSPDYSVRKTAKGIWLFIVGAVFVFFPHLAEGATGLRLPLEQREGHVVSYIPPQRHLGLSIAQPELPLLDFTALPVKRKVEVRPEAWLIQFDERVRDLRLSHSLVLPLDVYRRLQGQSALDRLIRENNRQELAKEEKEKAGGLLDIEIPIKLPTVISRIVGEGGPALKVSGTRHIELSGKSQWTEGEVQTSETSPSKFPSLNMNQTSRFTITGSIGSKVKVQVDQDSERETDLENTIKLRYEGEEDEIVQKIEMGNTNLNLPGSGLVSYSQHVQGLFGIKAVAKIGNLDLTAIASQEKGSTTKASFSAGAQEAAARRIEDYNYLAWTYFYLDDRYIDPGDGSHSLSPDDKILELKVFLDDKNERNNLNEGTWAEPCTAYIDPERPSVNQEFQEGQFHLLEPLKDYQVDWQYGWIRFETSIQKEHVVGVAYTTAERTVGDLTVAEGETRRLKLIKRQNPNPQKDSWKYEWKNVYNLGARNLDPRAEIKLEIYNLKVSPPSSTQDGKLLIQVLGLDQSGGAGGAPDGKLDPDPTIIDFAHGELIFPDPQPFRYGYRQDPDYQPTLNDSVPEIYTSNDNVTIRDNSKYYMEVALSSGGTATEYSLGHVNLIEGSEVVTLNGQRLMRGRDYTIIYEIGQISFLTQEATDPNAKIDVTYEYAPFFMPERKTLLGARGQYNLGENSWIGLSALYRDEKTSEENPRVGAEPIRDFVWDADLSLKFQPSIMTTLADALPYVETEAKSSLKIDAEVAQSRPNPNTKGHAFIDDFEGSRDYTDLGIRRTIWTKSSPPDTTEDLPRGEMTWYNRHERWDVEEIWPNWETGNKDEEVDVLTMRFTPATDSVGEFDPSSWDGVMRYLTQQDQRRSKYLEVWVGGAQEGQLVIDLGSISEDINADGKLNSEDDSLFGGCGDFILEPEKEDRGLDRVFGDDTKNVPGDDGDDDWYYEKGSNNYDKINGTEGNHKDPDGGIRPDTEDLDRDCSLDKINGYFQFAIDLSDPDAWVPGTESGTSGNFRLYRIALKDSSQYEKRGSEEPDWENIQYARMSLTGTSSRQIFVHVASIQLVGNKWQELGIFGANVDTVQEKFDIAVINTHEFGADAYSSPSGVGGDPDPQTGARPREQSLVLKYENLQPGHIGRAYRSLYSEENYTNYRRLKMFVHGDDHPESLAPIFFLRLGQDSANYYEYRTPVYHGWDPNDVDIDFDTLTVRKADRSDTSTADIVWDRYRIHGKPTLTRIRWLEVGVENPLDEALTGEIWIDEMRLTNVRKDPGMAVRASANASFADVLDLSASYQWTDSEFRKLGEKVSGKSSKTNQLYSATLHVDKFLPQSWGATIMAKGTWQHNLSLPKLKTGTDIVLPSELRREERTESTDRSASASFGMNAKAGHWLTKLTLNRIRLNLSAGDHHERSVERPYQWSENYSISANYDLSPGRKLSEWSVSPLFWTKFLFLPGFISGLDFFFLPNQLSFNGRVNRNQSLTIYRDDSETESLTHDFTGKAAVSMKPLRPLSTSYSYETIRDIRDKENLQFALDPKQARIGVEVMMKQNADATYSPQLFEKLFSQSFSYRTSYVEDSDPERYKRGERKVNSGNTRSANLTLKINWLLDFLPSPGEKKPFLFTPKGLVFKFKDLWKSIDPIKGTFARDKDFTRTGLLARPSLAYQFGFTNDPGVPALSATGTDRDSERISDSWQLGSGFSPFGDLKLTASYKRMESISRASTAEPLQTKSTTFPDISARWGSLEKLPFLSRFSSSSSVRSSYSKKVDVEGDEGLDSLNSRTTSTNFSPLFSWTANWKWGISSTFEGTWTKSRKENYQTGTKINETEKKGYNSNFSYSFRAPQGLKLPFLRRIRFESTLDLKLALSLDETIERAAIPGQRPEVMSHNMTWSIQPQAGYSFSSQVTGGLRATIQNSHDKKQDKKRKLREVGLWVDIKF